MADSKSSMATPKVSAAGPVKTKRQYEYPEVQYRTRPKVVKSADTQKNTHKLSKLYEYMDSIKDENFTGYIKVNFSQGSIGRVERFEEILRK